MIAQHASMLVLLRQGGLTSCLLARQVVEREQDVARRLRRRDEIQQGLASARSLTMSPTATQMPELQNFQTAN